MKINMGMLDRVLRGLLGIALLAWVLLADGPAWAWIGVVPLATALFGLCPLYSLLGINTCPADKRGA